MIKAITEEEVERLLDTTDRLLEACRKNNLFSKSEIKNMEDQTYYFRREFKNGNFDFSFMETSNEDDDDDWDSWDCDEED